MFTQGPELSDKIHLKPVSTQKKIVDLKYNEDGEYTYTWDFASLSNGNTIVIRNNMAYLFKDLSKPPIATKKVIDEAGYCYSIEFLEGRLFLVCANDTIEVDPNTLVSKFHNDSGAPLVYFSESEKAYLETHGPASGTCWIVSNENSKETKIQLNKNKNDHVISLKKISNESLALFSYSPDSKSDEHSQDAAITLWKKIGKEWKQTYSHAFTLPRCNHHVLYPSDDLMLILSTGKTATTVTPIELPSFKIRTPWVFSCGFSENAFFKNLSLTGKDTNSTFDPRTIVFYKRDLSDAAGAVENLYYLDLFTHSLKKLKLETTGHRFEKITAISHNEIYLAINNDAHKLNGDLGIYHLKIPKTLSASTALDMISSTTKMFQIIAPTILNYSDNDFSLPCPMKDTVQDPEEAKLHAIDHVKENELIAALIKQKISEEKKLRERYEKESMKHDQIISYNKLSISILKKIFHNETVDESEYASFLNQGESIKKFDEKHKIEIEKTESVIANVFKTRKKFEDMGVKVVMRMG